MLSNTIENLIGVYTPLTNIDGTYVNSVSGLDMPYIVRAIILILAVWGFTMILSTMLKMIGGKK